MIDLGTFGGPQSHAAGLDAYGHVVGYAEFPDRRSHAFLYCEGTLLDLNDLIPADSEWELVSADAINDVGQILGVGVKEGRLVPYLFQDGQVEVQPGGAHINNWGEMVGNVRDPQIHPAVVRDGALIDLNTLIPEDSGWTLYYAEDLNDVGQIVGWGKHDPFSGIRAFLLTPTDPEWNRSMPAQRRGRNAARQVRSPAADLCPSLPVVANR
jgi:probable HAF family extracellular repeat protein